MEPEGIFGETFFVLEKALDLRSKKHNLIVSNIANMDTPNYKSFDFMVEEELKKITGEKEQIKIKATQAGHLASIGRYTDNIKYRAVGKDPYNLRGDGNSVDIDKSMAKLSENSLLYNTSAQLIGRRFQGLKNVIQGGSR